MNGTMGTVGHGVQELLKGVDPSEVYIVVNGDTISTVMGAYTGKKQGMKVAHIEADLRSHYWFNPFPEEIDRMLIGRVATYHFVPGEKVAENLKGMRGVLIPMLTLSMKAINMP